MKRLEELTFVNRDDYLKTLRAYLDRDDDGGPAVVIIRSPTGYGKSRLTLQLCRTTKIAGLAFCIVEPEIQGHVGVARLHDGYFMQRCAEALSTMASSSQAPWPPLREFLRTRQWTTIKEKSLLDFLGEIPSWGSLYKAGFEYTSRVFARGEHAPKKLLTSDRSDAVRICEEYVEFVLKTNPTVFIIREFQHCDYKSLRSLLELCQKLPRLDLLLEYTTANGQFEPNHQKLLHRLAGETANFDIMDLAQLKPGHVDYLIRSSLGDKFSGTAEAHLDWDGNLRSIVELQLKVAFTRNITTPQQVDAVLGNLAGTVEAHILSLPAQHRMLLAVVAAHIEAITQRTLLKVFSTISPSVSPLSLQSILSDLVGKHKFLCLRDGAYALDNQTVAAVLHEIPMNQGLLAVAEKALREYYSGLVFGADFEDIGMAAAVRQLFRLCARTRDVAGMLRATETLAKEVRQAQDPSMYVAIVADAIAADPALYAADHKELVTWCAALAYDIGDYEQAEQLLALLPQPTSVERLTRACAQLETGRHDDALKLAVELRDAPSSDSSPLAADLIEALVAGCRGQHQQARILLEAIAGNAGYANSPLVGYAFRFREVVDGYAACIDNLNRSITCFDQFGLKKSKAYSQAATSVLVARTGEIEQARTMIAEAAQVLGEAIQDRHLMLNNMAAIELLAPQPNAGMCIKLLSEALRYVKDDYSEITVLSNLALAYWEARQLGPAVECARRVLQILEEHSFADQEIYWPTCFNAALVIDAAGQQESAAEILAIPGKQTSLPKLNGEYWTFRYGGPAPVDEQYSYLAGRMHHPLYLSHWIIDLDCLTLLTSERLQ